MQTILNKALALLSLSNNGNDGSYAEWLRKFEEYYCERDQLGIKLLVRSNGIPDDLRRTIWPKLIRLHSKPSSETMYTKGEQSKQRHSRSLSVNISPNDFEGFHLTEAEQAHLKSVMFTFSGHVPPILQVLLALIIKYCGHESVGEFITCMTPILPSEYYFYPAGKRDVLIFERVFEELLGKFCPSVMKRLTNLQLLVPDYVPQWEQLLFTFFIGIYQLEITVKIFDCFLVEGYKVLLRFALAHCIQRENKLAKVTSPADFEQELFRSEAQDHWHALKNTAFDLNFSRTLVERYRNRHRKLSDADLDVEDLRLLLQQTQKMPTLLQESNICSDRDWRNVWKWIPARHRMLQLDLAFRKSVHGGSMSTLYALCAQNEPLLLFATTVDGTIIGAFISKGLHSRPIRKKFSSPFFGTGETFIFQLGVEHPAAYHWTLGTPNANYVCADSYFLGFGCSEGRFGLWIGEGLSRVSCSQCLTFNNTSLVLEETDIYELEVFKFV